ncbi:hypothetical protein Hypma_008538 [Hypsizygus marmoreus]|uniref:Uncharacterized protein n=1 Tax=Hypsizygus marmoreus TaxID=39966 RepID=A0A369JRL4_HYPMA|nr:hypothetical protein Hypma_008538 [Hypsizygus marmoreus]
MSLGTPSPPLGSLVSLMMDDRVSHEETPSRHMDNRLRETRDAAQEMDPEDKPRHGLDAA